VNDELHFETRFLHNISEDISDINALLKKYAARLEEINICGNILSDVSNVPGENPGRAQLSKALSRSVDSIKEYSKDLSVMGKALDDIAYIYGGAEKEIGELFSYSFLPAAVNLINETHEKTQNYQENFMSGNFDNIKTRHISSNELILPDWLMDSVIKFNILAEGSEI